MTFMTTQINKNIKPQIFADRIFYYEGILENAKEIVDLIESTDSLLSDKDAIFPWRKWTASNNPDAQFGYQKMTDPNRLATSLPEVQYIYSSLWEVLEIVGADYTSSLGLELIPPSTLSIAKYIEGGYMGAHVDDYDQPGVIPIMSGVLYLNDDVEGGELSFPEQGVTIKPKAGSVVVFPSVKPFYHQSLEIKKGFKYMSPVFWIKRV